jgi:hypothetical protein
MARQKQLVEEYARMWPREVFDCLMPNQDGKKKKTKLVKGLELLNKPGVYVLYRNEIPYYIGQAAPLRGRLWHHASYPGARYHTFWNFFCAFVVPEKSRRNEIEGILIASMPTANSAKPKRKKAKMPKSVVQMAASIRRAHANPLTG